MSGSSDVPLASISSFSTSALTFGSQSRFSESPTFLYNRDALMPGMKATDEQHAGSGGGVNGSLKSHGSKRTSPYTSLPSPPRFKSSWKGPDGSPQKFPRASVGAPPSS